MNAISGIVPQTEVIGALILRETRTRFGAHQLGYLWAFIEPLLWIVTFYAMFAVAGRQAPQGMTMVTFIATGIVPYQIFREMVGRASSAVEANKGLLFYPQVRPLDLIIARCSLESVTWTTVLVALFTIDGLLHNSLRVHDPLQVLVALALATFLGGGLGIAVGAISVFNNTVQRLAPAVLRPLFWISGIFFTANALPSQVRESLLVNPVLHIVEIIRSGFFAEYEAPYASMGYVAMWALSATAVGLLLERVARRRLEVT